MYVHNQFVCLLVSKPIFRLTVSVGKLTAWQKAYVQLQGNLP